MEILKVEGRHPPFLNLTLQLSSLRKISSARTQTAAVACALLSLVDETKRIMAERQAVEASIVDKQAAESAFSRLIRGLVRGVLALISSSSPTPAATEAPPILVTDATPQPSSQDAVTISVSMAEIIKLTGGLDADELYARLIHLSHANALSLIKTFVIMRAAVPSDKNTYWPLLKYAVERLTRPKDGGVERLSRKAFEDELKKWYHEFLSDAGKPANKIAETAHKRRIERESYRAIGTALKIIRYAGIDINEVLARDGSMEYAIAVPETSIAEVKRGITKRVEAMQKLVTILSEHEPRSGGGKAGSFEVGLVNVMDALGPEIRVSRLRELMILIGASGFYGLENIDNEWVSIVSLNRMEPLPPHDLEAPNAATDSDKVVPEDVRLIQTTYAEILEKHDLQVLRAQCMVLFAALPTENRKQFIDTYFTCVTAEDLKKALENAVGDVGDEDLSEILRDLLVQVRRERFGKEMEKLKDAQSAVCKAPFDQKILVNAGPGSGKTHVLMMRCAHLIHAQSIKPSEILILAFNRAVVYEIRDRIHNLFRELGYGSYVRSLDVSTFHSFALRRSSTDDLFEENAIEDDVHKFAQIISSNNDKAQKIAGTYKAILVDEFQDMNEDFYAVVKALATHCQGGAMVIGDDDQDILTWNRRKWSRKWRKNHGEVCPLEAVDYFTKYREAFTPEVHEITLNFRSVPEIVSAANTMIKKAKSRIKFRRMKELTQLEPFRTENGEVVRPFNPDTLGDIIQGSISRCKSNGESETIAILCRSNRECRRVYEQLASQKYINPEWLEILGSEDFPLYQLRPTGAMMDICTRRDQWDFVEQHIWDDLLKEYDSLGHADKAKGVEDLGIIFELIKIERGRPRMRDIKDFINETRASDIERLKAKKRLNVRYKITISTVHKVKGLEFDSVVVMPSSEEFPFNKDDKDNEIAIYAAEEARLYYVAMTRARDRLYAGWGERERAWHKSINFNVDGEIGHSALKGSPEEIFISWPGLTAQVNNGLQDYIEKHVNVGDKLELRYQSQVFHQGIQVGILSRRCIGDAGPLHVANVIRYSCGKYFERKYKDRLWKSLHSSMKQRGWFYIVLTES